MPTKRENYRVQDGCWNCKHRIDSFKEVAPIWGHDALCAVDGDVPPDVSHRDDLPDEEYIKGNDDRYEWEGLHCVERAAICDAYEKEEPNADPETTRPEWDADEGSS